MENVNVITTRSGRVLNPVASQGKSPELPIDLEETDDADPKKVKESANVDTPKELLPAHDGLKSVNGEDGCLCEFG
ncbi:unnamed protein product [Arabis nemorensis]|uniref:Uncharacterized protein n=1 Tax=Arabis nemorensis TaxID=586526 RepID=A0A565CSV3_9BRAS|nr:unnamed protein product [Arabis nemorensis]